MILHLAHAAHMIGLDPGFLSRVVGAVVAAASRGAAVSNVKAVENAPVSINRFHVTGREVFFELSGGSIEAILAADYGVKGFRIHNRLGSFVPVTDLGTQGGLQDQFALAVAVEVLAVQVVFVVVGAANVVAHLNTEQQSAVDFVAVNVLQAGLQIVRRIDRVGIHRVLAVGAPLHDDFVLAVAVEITQGHILGRVAAAHGGLEGTVLVHRVGQAGTSVQFLHVLDELGFQLIIQRVADDAVAAENVSRLPGFTVVIIELCNPGVQVVLRNRGLVVVGFTERTEQVHVHTVPAFLVLFRNRPGFCIVAADFAARANQVTAVHEIRQRHFFGLGSHLDVVNSGSVSLAARTDGRKHRNSQALSAAFHTVDHRSHLVHRGNGTVRIGVVGGSGVFLYDTRIGLVIAFGLDIAGFDGSDLHTVTIDVPGNAVRLVSKETPAQEDAVRSLGGDQAAIQVLHRTEPVVRVGSRCCARCHHCRRGDHCERQHQ